MPAHALRTVPPADAPISHDGLLHLAKNFIKHPDILIGDGNSILGTGMPGSGKTTVMALLLEQFGACGIPFATFDLEGDLRSVVDLLPRGVLATAGNCPTAEDMYNGGLQVVFDLASWGEDSNRAAILISRTVNGLLAHMKSLPSHLRVPFLVGLDEAAYWLPQIRKGCNHLSGERLEELFAAFHTLAIRGRKMGLIPMLFTQRFAEVHKDVLAPGTYILMRQTTDTDLKRYMEYIDASAFGEDEDDMTRLQMRQHIATFKKGQAIIKQPTGRQRLVQFHNRASLHTSHAPKAQAAANLYRDVPFDPHRRYGSDQTGENADMEVVSSDSKLRVLPTRGGTSPTLKEQVYALLEKDPTLTATDLVTLTHRPLSSVKMDREEYFARHPERRPPPHKRDRGAPPTLKEQVYALLEKDPTLTATAMAKAAARPLGSVHRYRIDYFNQYPERAVDPEASLKEQVYAMLEKDPTLTATAMASALGCSVSPAQKYRSAYFAIHPERRSWAPPTLKEQVYAMLEKDPTLTATD